MQGSDTHTFFSRGAFWLLVILMVTTPLSPLTSLISEDSSAASGTRHVYDFHDGSTEYVALYQGANPDLGAKVSLPRGALVTDVSMTLSGASATGWSQILTDTRDHWIDGQESNTDDRSGDLTLSLDSVTESFYPHGFDEVTNANSDAWLDNGSYALRQPHTSNATESLFSQQITKSSSSFMAQSQGAILKHHDWLFLSTWSSSTFSNVVHRLYPNNASRESIITLDQAQCNLPQKHSSSYYGYYGFRDWTVTDDERLFGILSGYRYTYGSNAPVNYHRVMEMDISRDSVWTCIDSYDISAGAGDYTGIAYDRDNDKVWVVHNQGGKIVSYDFSGDGTSTWDRDEKYYTFTSSSSSSRECGQTNQMVRGLEVNSTTFFMRCQKDSYYNDRDQLEAWDISGSAQALIPQSNTRQISRTGYGLQFDGNRFISVDSGYSTWSGATLYYREFGTSWMYDTTPAPGTTTWYGPVTTYVDDVLAANVQTYWSAASIGDRVDYWVSADNGTHWEQVVSNSTIHFDYPGKELVWKAQLIGSTAVSWWVDIDASTQYATSGDWTSPYYNTGTKVGKVRPTWVADLPAGTSLQVVVSNDNGSTWLDAENNVETSFSTDAAGNTLRYAIFLTTNNTDHTPSVDSFTLWYEEGYPDRPMLDVGGDGSYDWEAMIFLNESAVVATDDSQVGVIVKKAPTLIDAFNDYIPENGEGMLDIPIGIKAASSGRIKVSNIDVTYAMQTRAIDASFEGGLASPDGAYRNFITRVAPGDEVDRVTEATIALNHSYGENPSFTWLRGDTCSTNNDGGGIVVFDTANCTSTVDALGVVSIWIPTKVNWSWNDEADLEAIITVKDDLGVAVDQWDTTEMDLVIENDIQLDGLRVWEETGRQLFPMDWVRGGFNLSFAGGLHFQDSQLMPPAGSFSLRVMGQNVTYDGDPMGASVLLHEEVNPAFGEYNLTFVAPIESAPGGMIFYVQAVNLENGSTYSNPGYNTIRLILDGNSPLVLSSTPTDGEERHAGSAGVGQAVSVVVQDSVDPPQQITLNYWVGCLASDAIGCNDYNFDGLPNEDEYVRKTLSSPETRVGGINIFEGLIDDSMLLHEQRVSYFITGKDQQDNEIAMGGGPVCPVTNVVCGDRPGEVLPDWSADLSTYFIRQEFEPMVDLGNSSIIGHDDYEPLHPGIPYTARILISDQNGWDDIQFIQVALGGDLDDEEASMFITLTPDEAGNPVAVMETGSDYIAVSNLYSTVELDETNQSIVIIQARFQLTWQFPESFDTNGVSHFIPKVLVTDLPCNEGEVTPCFETRFGMGDDWWSLDNDFRFDTEQGHIRAVELRNSENHYNSDNIETIIGAGQALRVNGRVLFSEDETPAPAGAFDVVFGDFENNWRTSTRADGEFSLDLLVPSVRSGHLDLRLTMDDLPGLAFDETPTQPRVRLAVDSARPTIESIGLNGILPGSPISIGDASNLKVMLETNDENGFDYNEAALLHYRVKAGEAEISRGSVSLPDITPFGSQFFWSGVLDLTDSGATTLLPSYTVDVWVSGSDEAGNPFDTFGNSMIEPYASWPLALLGPRIDLQDESTVMQWDNPSPYEGESASMVVTTKNLAGEGDVTFALQRLVDGGFWSTSSQVALQVSEGQLLSASLPVVADVPAGQIVQYRVLVLVDGVEMDRHTVDSLLVKEETIRDGDALSQQVSEDLFSITLFVIALISVSFGLWAMVMQRRMLNPPEEDEADQTDVVAAEMEQDAKIIPDLAGSPPVPPQPDMSATPQLPSLDRSVPPPVPPTGLPNGWTQEQWASYGWQYIDALTK
ncbi:MAG: hypothetical protein CMA65_02690 [Euryarchaeota archaeon]|nr:hypothetical protein [Euryarchaeota archaeon]